MRSSYLLDLGQRLRRLLGRVGSAALHQRRLCRARSCDRRRTKAILQAAACEQEAPLRREEKGSGTRERISFARPKSLFDCDTYVHVFDHEYLGVHVNLRAHDMAYWY